MAAGSAFAVCTEGSAIGQASVSAAASRATPPRYVSSDGSRAVETTELQPVAVLFAHAITAVVGLAAGYKEAAR